MKLLAGNSNLPLARSISDYLEVAADRCQRPPLRRRRGVRRDQRERPRRGRVRHPVDQLSGERQSDGAVDLHRRAAPRVGQADYRGAALLRLCAPGPEAGAAHADLGQARRQSDHHGRRQPGSFDRSSCGADPGLLRHPDRQPVRFAGDRDRHPGALRKPRPAGCLAGRRRSGPRARTGQAAQQRAAGDRRQAPRARRRIGGDEHHRRRRRPHLRPDRRHRRFRPARCATPPRR